MKEIAQELLHYIKGFADIFLFVNIIGWILGVVFFIIFTIFKEK